jgi:hypothetical protein
MPHLDEEMGHVPFYRAENKKVADSAWRCLPPFYFL